MKNKYAYLSSFIVCLSLFISMVSPAVAQGDLSFSASTITAEQGENIKVNISASGFEDIVSLQFTIRYDSSVINALGVGDYGLPYLSSTNVAHAPQQQEGIIGFAWFDESLLGQTLSDGDVIFSITFKVVGEPGTSTDLIFGGEPVLIEVTDVDGLIVEPTFNDGSVMVLINSANEALEAPGFEFYPIAPNPAGAEPSWAIFHLERAGRVQLTISDIQGRAVYNQTETFGAGEQRIQLARSIFPASGTYLIQLATSQEAAVVQKLIVLE